MGHMTFSEKLRMLIGERDLTQKALASSLKIPASTFGGYVQGTSEPDFDTLKIIAQYFGVSADYLLDMPESHSKLDSEKELLRIFRVLTPEQQTIYLEQGKAFLRANARKTIASSPLVPHDRGN